MRATEVSFKPWYSTSNCCSNWATDIARPVVSYGKVGAPDLVAFAAFAVFEEDRTKPAIRSALVNST